LVYFVGVVTAALSNLKRDWHYSSFDRT